MWKSLDSDNSSEEGTHPAETRSGLLSLLTHSISLALPSLSVDLSLLSTPLLLTRINFATHFSPPPSFGSSLHTARRGLLSCTGGSSSLESHFSPLGPLEELTPSGLSYL